MKIIIAILIFSIIILFHEFGHFLLAKKNGIEVVEFSLGMGPRLWSTEKGGTKYSLKLLPLGGSCMMLGEDADDCRPGTFNSASVLGRISVVAAGPVFNFVFAFVLSLVIVASIGYTPATVSYVEEGSAAEAAGLQVGDQITDFDGYHIDISEDMNIYLAVKGAPNDRVAMTVKRDGEKLDIGYRPETIKRYLLGFNRDAANTNQPLEVASLIQGMPMEEAGVLPGDVITAVNGVEVPTGEAYDRYLEEHPLSDQEPVQITYEHNGHSREVTVTPAVYQSVSVGFQYNLVREKGNVFQILKYSALEVKYWIRTTILSLKELITGQYGMEDLSGPVGVVGAIGDTYEQSKSEGTFWVWMNMLNMAILLSANLGVMNLLPVPALDGGRLVFLIIEAVLRRPVNRQVEGMIHFAGLMLLMLLMVVVMYNDIIKLI